MARCAEFCIPHFQLTVSIALHSFSHIQPTIKNMYQTLPSDSSDKKHLLIYTIPAFILLILCIVDLPLNSWYTYCLFEFGLHSVHMKNGDDIPSISSIGDLQDELCGSVDLLDGVCPGFCGNLKNMKNGGAAMIAFGVISVVLLTALLVLHVLAFLGKVWRSRVVTVLVISPFLFWLLGVIIYGGVVNIAGIKSTNAGGADMKLGGGVGLCIVVAIVQLVAMILGLVFSRRAFVPQPN